MVLCFFVFVFFLTSDPKHISTLVRNINVTSGTTCKLEALSPGQKYVAWIRAVSAAGPSEKVNTTFTINHHEDYGMYPIRN